MKPEHSPDWISAFLDGELSPEQRAEAARRLGLPFAAAPAATPAEATRSGGSTDIPTGTISSKPPGVVASHDPRVPGAESMPDSVRDSMRDSMRESAAHDDDDSGWEGMEDAALAEAQSDFRDFQELGSRLRALPRLQLPDDFAGRVLRVAEREILAGRSASSTWPSVAEGGSTVVRSPDSALPPPTTLLDRQAAEWLAQSRALRRWRLAFACSASVAAASIAVVIMLSVARPPNAARVTALWSTDSARVPMAAPMGPQMAVPHGLPMPSPMAAPSFAPGAAPGSQLPGMPEGLAPGMPFPGGMGMGAASAEMGAGGIEPGGATAGMGGFAASGELEPGNAGREALPEGVKAKRAEAKRAEAELAERALRAKSASPQADRQPEAAQSAGGEPSHAAKSANGLADKSTSRGAASESRDGMPSAKPADEAAIGAAANRPGASAQVPAGKTATDPGLPAAAPATQVQAGASRSLASPKAGSPNDLSQRVDSQNADSSRANSPSAPTPGADAPSTDAPSTNAPSTDASRPLARTRLAEPGMRKTQVAKSSVDDVGNRLVGTLRVSFPAHLAADDRWRAVMRPGAATTNEERGATETPPRTAVDGLPAEKKAVVEAPGVNDRLAKGTENAGSSAAVPSGPIEIYLLTLRGGELRNVTRQWQKMGAVVTAGVPLVADAKLADRVESPAEPVSPPSVLLFRFARFGDPVQFDRVHSAKAAPVAPDNQLPSAAPSKPTSIPQAAEQPSFDNLNRDQMVQVLVAVDFTADASSPAAAAAPTGAAPAEPSSPAAPTVPAAPSPGSQPVPKPAPP